jgi:IS30 family transposase
MGQHYSQISFAERRRIQDLRDVKVPVSAIAKELGRHRSTIHREIRRNFYHDPFRDRWGKDYDRGTEFFAYKALAMDSYFCDPHSPWQKGGVENANGRVRRHLPLASSEITRTPAALTALARRLNDTPRGCLGYRTPAEVFAANLASLATSAQVGNPEHPLPRPLVPVGPQA